MSERLSFFFLYSNSCHGILLLGKVARGNFTQTHLLHDVAGDVAYVLGFFVALIMWGFGILWLVFALASIYKSRPFPFNMGWWGFTFPIGTFAIGTISLGVEMPSTFFRVSGTVGKESGFVYQSDIQIRFSGWL